MNYITHNITLDIHDINSQAVIQVKEGDTQRRLAITLCEDGKPYRITEDCIASFTAEKPDGNKLFNDCEIVDNKIQYDFTVQTTVVPGMVKCEIRLYGGDGGLITSPRFSILVDKKVVNDGDVIESSFEGIALPLGVQYGGTGTTTPEEARAALGAAAAADMVAGTYGEYITQTSVYYIPSITVNEQGVVTAASESLLTEVGNKGSGLMTSSMFDFLISSHVRCGSFSTTYEDGGEAISTIVAYAASTGRGYFPVVYGVYYYNEAKGQWRPVNSYGLYNARVQSTSYHSATISIDMKEEHKTSNGTCQYVVVSQNLHGQSSSGM